MIDPVMHALATECCVNIDTCSEAARLRLWRARETLQDEVEPRLTPVLLAADIHGFGLWFRKERKKAPWPQAVIDDWPRYREESKKGNSGVNVGGGSNGDWRASWREDLEDIAENSPDKPRLVEQYRALAAELPRLDRAQAQVRFRMIR